MTTKLAKKLAKNFICESCDYACSKQSDYEKHITTSKHKNTTIGDFIQPKTRQTFLCSCGKSYPHRASLFNHKKKCKLESGSLETDSLETELKNLTSMVIDLMKSNSVLQQQLIEVCKIIKESTGGRGEISVSEDKIIRRIAKEIIIDK